METKIKEFIEDFCFHGSFNMFFDEEDKKTYFYLIINKADYDYDVKDFIEFIEKHISKEKIKMSIIEDPLEDWANLRFKVKLK